MEGMLFALIGGYIIGKLHTSWSYYRKTGEFIEDVEDKFKNDK